MEEIPHWGSHVTTHTGNMILEEEMLHIKVRVGRAVIRVVLVTKLESGTNRSMVQCKLILGVFSYKPQRTMLMLKVMLMEH